MVDARSVILYGGIRIFRGEAADARGCGEEIIGLVATAAASYLDRLVPALEIVFAELLAENRVSIRSGDEFVSSSGSRPVRRYERFLALSAPSIESLAKNKSH
jgi:hypothetical protein